MAEAAESEDVESAGPGSVLPPTAGQARSPHKGAPQSPEAVEAAMASPGVPRGGSLGLLVWLLFLRPQLRETGPARTGGG